MSRMKIVTRDDGLRIITKRLTYTNKVKISIGVMAGSAQDPKDRLGLFHFSEHMAFQGTKTRTAEEIVSFFDQYTRENNAGTRRQSVEYYGVAVKFNQDKLLQILTDIYFNSTFPEEQLQKERGVVAAEIAEDENDDDSVVFHNLLSLLYKDNPAQQSQLGTVESLEMIDRNTLIKTHKEFYIPRNTVIVATGNVHQDLIVEKVNALIPMKFKSSPIKTYSDESLLAIDRKEKIQEKTESKTATIFMGVKIPVFNQKERFVADILADLLGGGENSLIYRELRQKRGLVYGASCGVHGESPLFNIFYFNSKTRPEKMTEVKDLTKDIIFRYPLNPVEFDALKEKKRIESYIALESADSWNNDIMAMVRKGQDPIFLDGYPKKMSKILDSINFEDVVEMRKKFITEERLATSIVTAE